MDGWAYLFPSVLCCSISAIKADTLVEQPSLSKYCQVERRLLPFLDGLDRASSITRYSPKIVSGHREHFRKPSLPSISCSACFILGTHFEQSRCPPVVKLPLCCS